MFAVALREILVVLDDDLIERVDVLSEELGVDRSEIMRRGVRAVLDADDSRKADGKLQSSYRSMPQDQAIVGAAEVLARETTPSW
jgi:metal-responsive CopG/Arc/MetJ family transcriptional regulator